MAAVFGMDIMMQYFEFPYGGVTLFSGSSHQAPTSSLASLAPPMSVDPSIVRAPSMSFHNNTFQSAPSLPENSLVSKVSSFVNVVPPVILKSCKRSTVDVVTIAEMHDILQHYRASVRSMATYETRRSMDGCIRDLCNSDVKEHFELGKDVSLPETFVHSSENPLLDLGGKPPSLRRVLAFFASRMHGEVRSSLLQHWENKDPDMKIFGKLKISENKISYIEYMKSSKYCICAKGYEVNSPRVWRYMVMQQRVKKVQQHFLWHSKPVKYEIFHMILHSIWYNRVFRVNPNI
ncbi:hypothetical protein L1987_00116 [Smallanthus sonchifolius]|uniref:Uncharacterized protein n=1 Tax=Smallanthus sonchifolius TaxID=185202 RepID=A0ACB9K1D0_9ASTR|nr:hypothetical protein L1987_00116 [Smallanthus sonchifolius]